MVKALTLPERVIAKPVSRYVHRTTSMMSVPKHVILTLRVKPSDLSARDAQPESAPEPEHKAPVPQPASEEPCDLTIMTKVRAQQRFLRADAVPQDKRSDCWWCAGSFETEAFLIPHSVVSGEPLGYGSFCIPQCAVAYLHAEKGLDASTLFERDHMLNHYYGRPVSGCGLAPRARIAPAHDPKRLLQRYFGSLTYPEYRKLCMSSYLLAPAERPITRVVSELHDVIDPLVLKEFGARPAAGSNGYRVKMKKHREL